MPGALTTEEQSRRAQAFRLAVRHYVRQVRIDWPVAIGALNLPGLGTILVRFVPPLIIAKVLTEYAGERGATLTVGDLVPYMALFGGVWLLGELCWRVGIHFLNRMDSRGMERLYLEGMDALLAKDLAFFHDNFAGSLTKKVIGYAKSYEEFGDVFAFRVISNVLPALFALAVLWRFSPWLPVVLLAWLVLTAAVTLPLIRRRQRLVDEREAASNEAAGHVADVITNMDAVRAFAREGYESDSHRRKVRRYVGLMLRSWDYHNRVVDLATTPFYVLANLSGLVVAVLVGGGGVASIETVFVTFTYYASVTHVVWEFNDIYRQLESNLSEAAQFTELLLDEPTVHDAAEPEPLAPVGAEVRFDRVTFAYPKGDGPLFDRLDLVVGDGEKVGLIGRSGGGKSTVTKLLLRLMDIDDGRILIGGQDITRISQRDLRSMIAYVPQDPAMFHRSLRDNIAYGRLDATEVEVREAAAAAHAAEFIESLPEGYGTLVGERGIKLSGGQRQRIAIARAIIRRAPILVLDEATSSLDSESEALIQLALASLMERSTALVIAHRLSTVQAMDRLVVMEAGRVVEQGSHGDLLRSGGTYAELWARQSGGFLLDETAA